MTGMLLQGLHGVPAPDRLFVTWMAGAVLVARKAFADGGANGDALHGVLEIEREIGRGELHVVHDSLWQMFPFGIIGLVCRKMCCAGMTF